MPHDFRNKSFQKVLRGYAPEEVDDYIAYLNEEYKKLERRTADSERKLALAQKKLDEYRKNSGTADSVGPAAREAAAKLLREAEEKKCALLAAAEQEANEAAEKIVRDAKEKAERETEAALCRAEAILAEAKAEAEVHKNDAQRVYDTARGICKEIDAFREKLFGLYNSHLDAIEGITDAARGFMEEIDGRYPEGAASADAADSDEAEDDASDDDGQESVPEAEDTLPEEEEDALEEPETEEEEAPSVESPENGEEEDPVETEHANLSFMDKLFCEMPDDGDIGDGTDESGAFTDAVDGADEDETADDADTPVLAIDWKNRSAVGLTGDADVPSDFRPADGFEDLDTDEEKDDAYGAYDDEYDEYDEYRPYEEEEEPAEANGEADEEIGEDEEDDGYRAMDSLFREDKSKREMSLTDEFNIIFADSKSSENVKEIRSQPTVAPEAPKNPKKHKKF
ncbi:MAG: DivIVA domain-containing protein [Eubacteriales bacterium]